MVNFEMLKQNGRRISYSTSNISDIRSPHKKQKMDDLNYTHRVTWKTEKIHFYILHSRFPTKIKYITMQWGNGEVFCIIVLSCIHRVNISRQSTTGDWYDW